MAKHRVIAGLDIGTTKICALIAEVAANGDTTIVGSGTQPSTGIRKGVVVDIERASAEIESAVDAACRQSGHEVTSVYVGVTGEHIGSLNSAATVPITHAGREVTDQDIERVHEAARAIVLPPDRQILHAIPRGYTLDGQGGVHRPTGMSADRLEVECHIVHGAATHLNNVARCVSDAGLDVDAQVLEPLATGGAVLTPAEKELGVCLVDIGGGTSDMAVFIDGAVTFSAVLPVGGSHVTADLACGLSVSMEEAERLKTESGAAVTRLVPEEDLVPVLQLGRSAHRRLRRRVLAEVIEPRMSELFDQVYLELQKARLLGSLPAGLVISGGGSQLLGSAEAAHEATGLPVRVGRPFGIGGLDNILGSPTYATAVGLVRFGAAELSHKRAQKLEGRPILRAVRRAGATVLDWLGF